MAWRRVTWSVGAWLAMTGLASSARYDGKLQITAVDEASHEPLAVRMELRDARNRPVRSQPAEAIVAGQSIYFDGSVTLELRRGNYRFLIEAGPEYETRLGEFTIDRHAEDTEEMVLKRTEDMHAEGWWAGDLDVQMPLADAPLVMRARAVDVAPITARVNDRGHCRTPKLGSAKDDGGAGTLFYGPWASLDQRRGGGLLVVGAQRDVDVCQWKVDDPSMPTLTAGREAGACVVALSPTAWDFPLWVATGKLDAVLVLNRYAGPYAAAANNPGERPCDAARFSGKMGPGRCSESIYHHLLNCGLRLPPAAGSGTGAFVARGGAVAPLGFNRTYVQCGETCNREQWLAGLRAGQVTITNGPLLRTRVEGQPPGAVFPLEPGETHEFQIALNLSFYEQYQVEYLEIVKDGRAIHQIRLADFAQRAGRLPPVSFDESGWFLVRAVTNNPDFYQFASTGPYYVEANYKPRVSRASVQYFLDWLDAAAKEFAGNEPVIADFGAAKKYWQKLADRATAE